MPFDFAILSNLLDYLQLFVEELTKVTVYRDNYEDETLAPTHFSLRSLFLFLSKEA
jgi:hypothetical protein